MEPDPGLHVSIAAMVNCPRCEPVSRHGEKRVNKLSKVAADYDANPIRPADVEGVAAAVDLLTDGRIVAVPTETVYGLAADATNGEAVAAIYAAKGRPRFNPLICHVDGMEMAKTIGVFDAVSARLARSFWPGPLTLIVPLAKGAPVHPLVTAGLDTVAIRAPQGHLRDIVSKLGRPVAAPSANASGKISPTSARAVRDSLTHVLPLILDAGPASVGLESTIIRVTGDEIICLRPGGLALDEIADVAGRPVHRAAPDTPIASPGMLASHYAPDCPLRLEATTVRPGEALLAFGPNPVAGSEQAAAIKNLSPTGDLTEAAANLFAMLGRLNAARPAAIAVAPVPNHGLGEAINDRLARAAVPPSA